MDEVAQHFFANLKVSDHTIFERSYSLDIAGRTANHAFGFGSHCQGASVLNVNGDDRRFVEDDAAATYVDQGIRSP